MTNEGFYKSLSEADWDTATAIETEIGKLLEQGLTENVALKFVRTVMEVCKAVPGATVEGVFDAALSAGLGYLGDERTLARIRMGQFTFATGGIKKRKPRTSKLKSTLK